MSPQGSGSEPICHRLNWINVLLGGPPGPAAGRTGVQPEPLRPGSSCKETDSHPPLAVWGACCTAEGPGENEVVQARRPARGGHKCRSVWSTHTCLGGRSAQVPTERPCSCSQANRRPVSVTGQTGPHMRSLEPASLPTAAEWSCCAWAALPRGLSWGPCQWWEHHGCPCGAQGGQEA